MKANTIVRGERGAGCGYPCAVVANLIVPFGKLNAHIEAVTADGIADRAGDYSEHLAHIAHPQSCTVTTAERRI